MAFFFQLTQASKVTWHELPWRTWLGAFLLLSLLLSDAAVRTESLRKQPNPCWNQFPYCPCEHKAVQSRHRFHLTAVHKNTNSFDAESSWNNSQSQRGKKIIQFMVFNCFHLGPFARFGTTLHESRLLSTLNVAFKSLNAAVVENGYKNICSSAIWGQL